MMDKQSGASLQQEIDSGDRFSFGDNWSRFLRTVDEPKILAAVESLKGMLDVESLDGFTFLDVGCGSGLFSLAARKMGARVLSFDYDPKSVACAGELKHRYYENDECWEILTGSVLDQEFLGGLGQFDVVYSWGVLHHTGDMWAALANVVHNVAPKGKLFIAIYNFQPLASRYWTFVKSIFNHYPLLRPLLFGIHLIYPTLPSFLMRLVRNRGNPRGMNTWYDLRDWLGGYPFETATPEQIFSFYRDRRFQLTALRTVGGRLGCNEFVFVRAPSP